MSCLGAGAHSSTRSTKGMGRVMFMKIPHVPMMASRSAPDHLCKVRLLHSSPNFGIRARLNALAVLYSTQLSREFVAQACSFAKDEL